MEDNSVPSSGSEPTDELLDDANAHSPPQPESNKFRYPNPFTNRDELLEESPPVGVQAWLPIVVASILFSLAHFGQGTAPIPLFFLSLGLGFIYQRTHRIWPSIVAHMLVNGLAVVQLKIAVDYGMKM